MTARAPAVPTASVERAPRSAGPDQLKALLLVLVVFGHAYMVPLGEDVTRYLIYSVHMPLFLFLSGYLLRAESLRRRSFGGLLAHYWWRMLLAWLAISVLWRLTQQPQRGWSWSGLVGDLVLEPAFHLWYIPVLMLAIVVAWLAARTPWPGMVLGQAAVAAYVGTLVADSILGDLPFDKRFTLYFCYFAFGMMVRNGWARVLPPWWALGAVVAGLVMRLAVFEGVSVLNQPSRLVLALGALSLVPVVLRWLERPIPVIGPSLERIGVFSLWVYLLHPFLVFGALAPDELRPRDPWFSLAVTIGVMVLAALLTWAWERAIAAIGARRRSRQLETVAAPHA
ncbi:acyltransferase family protein [Demequina maris]|uniref:acyltransferase family protein n=1 Tax=Demequina maris TaxID=1638982 RepID=UPI000780A5FB|nr:acyltransferase [Demequina maris]